MFDDENLRPPVKAPADLEIPADAVAKRYQNAWVTVYYQNGVSDTGWLTFLETPWIELSKDTGERLLIPMMAVRLIKILQSPKREADAETLLRASGPQETNTK